jgi:hypothetical protein
MRKHVMANTSTDLTYYEQSTEQTSDNAKFGDTNTGGYPQWGLALHGLALTLAKPKPPALTPLVLAPISVLLCSTEMGG